MAKHPLDISNFLGESEKPEPSTKGFKPSKAKSNSFKKPSNSQASPSPKPSSFGAQPRIEKKFWDQLNPESRRIFTSRMWKNIDFNPMLRELTDLSKLTEKWLRWAIPTYANGVKEGPVKDWFEGKKGDADFHYILVGEHLKHLKEVRQKKKEEQKPEVVETSQEVVEPPTPLPTDEEKQTSPELKMALNELDDHIQWFQNYLEGNPSEDKNIPS